ncbi:MAG TPA: TIGR04053 family radical SAM/SPASM domain-containing protein [Candidatus Saccharimonadales bacterium]|jgi:radical SAM protein|nr:TIGR04053 family radical SAM/SPASM domain-containing protein [Candidatus Saccharimonadales bacterium]
MNTEFDLNKRPLVVIWETTQSCDLACFHCRASAQSRHHPLEMSTEEGENLIDEMTELKPPIFIFTGGDPLKRPDIYHLVRYAAERGLHPAMTPSVTPLLTRTAIGELKKAGLSRLAVSLDGSVPALHDVFRGVPGSYARTLEAIHWANEAQLPIQVNTSVTTRNLADLEDMANLLKNLKIVLWSVFFLIPIGRGQMKDLPSGEEFEAAFAKLYRFAGEFPFKIKTTEAQHYRRFILQQRRHAGEVKMIKPAIDGMEQGGPGLLPINDGKGFVFVSHIGEVYPSGFLPISGGSLRRKSLTEIYQNSELFRSLRDTGNLKGKCGKCEYREICGGSRARAYAMTGDLFAEEPCCVFQPAAVQQ